MSPTPAVRVAGVSKQFRLRQASSLKDRLLSLRTSRTQEFWALRNIDIDINESETVGLIGPNGSGKTTLLKLIAGVLTPTTGYIERRGRVAALLELGAGFHPDLTGRENVYVNGSILGLSRRELDARFDAIVDFSGVERFIDNQVKFYSSGMYVRLAFAVAVHVDPKVLLVDEVLSVGDEPFQRKCMERIKLFQQEGRTIMLVTHGLDLVRELCDQVVMLDKGEIFAAGKPFQAIRAFRDRYAGEGAEGDEMREWGTRDVVIASYALTDGDGHTKDRFEPGEPFAIEVMLEGREPVDNPIVGFNIHNHMGVLVCGTNTAMRSVSTGRLNGAKRVTFRCPSLPLVEGTYSVTIAVASHDEQTHYHWLDHCARFRVASDSPDAGLLHLEPSIVVD